MAKSIMEQLAELPEAERALALAGMDPETLLWDWSVWGRPEQQAPEGDWNIWMYLAGRGAGKTRSAAEWVREQAKHTNTGQRRFALVARTAADVRDVIVEGESGIINVSPPSERPLYEPSKRRLTWPNGNTATCFCVTPDTEAFTKERGWVAYTELSINDLILTLNTDTEMAEWKPVKEIHTFNVEDEPVAVFGGRFHKSVSTMEHRWPVKLRNGKVKITRTKNIIANEEHTKTRLITSSVLSGLPTNKTLSDSLVALCGWYLTEGTLSPSNTIAIFQSSSVNADKCLEIENLLTLLFGPQRSKQSNTGQRVQGKTWIQYPPSSGRDVITYHLDYEASLDILQWFEQGNEKVPTISFLQLLTVEQLEIFISACMDGDGHRRGSSGSFEQKSSKRRDAVGYALTLLGWSHQYTERKTKYKDDYYTSYGVHYRKGRYTTLPRQVNESDSKGRLWSSDRSTYSTETFTGVVWCPTVENSTWFARKDGKTFFTGNTADEPDSLRGPQFTHAWGDEVAAWRQTPDAAGMTAFDNLRVGTRLGANPKIMITTTPKRVPLLYKLIEEAKGGRVVISRGSTMDNSGNLSGAYLDAITGVYAGTRLAQQELYGEMLDSVEGALWTDELIELNRQNALPLNTPLRCIGVDPSVAENPRDECGIVVVASTGERDLYKRQAWVLEDASVHGSPEVWANRVVAMARKWGCPVIAEVNQGGALVRNAINAIDPNIKVLEVHSKYGKQLRAEPVVLGYEQGRVHHIGFLAELESQMLSWIPGEGKSPDRVDALVHALTALMIKPPAGFVGGKLTAKSMASRRMPDARSSLFRLR